MSHLLFAAADERTDFPLWEYEGARNLGLMSFGAERLPKGLRDDLARWNDLWPDSYFDQAPVGRKATRIEAFELARRVQECLWEDEIACFAGQFPPALDRQIRRMLRGETESLTILRYPMTPSSCGTVVVGEHGVENRTFNASDDADFRTCQDWFELRHEGGLANRLAALSVAKQVQAQQSGIVAYLGSSTDIFLSRLPDSP